MWCTGLSGAGKAMIAQAVEKRLRQMGCRTCVFSGHNVRHGQCADLDFSPGLYSENISVVALTVFLSSFRADRERVPNFVRAGDFLEISCH